jgi:hypothetical protein
MTTTNRWYTFGRKTPSTSTEIGPIEEGTVYVIEGWSRTKEAAIARRAKLDRAGRQGIMVFSPSRQQAMADVMECFRGVVVDGYISPENKRAGRQIVKAMVMREIFCPYTGAVMDMRRAVVVDSGYRTFVCAATHWDKIVLNYPGGLPAMERANKRPVTVYDGRGLFK